MEKTGRPVGRGLLVVKRGDRLAPDRVTPISSICVSFPIMARENAKGVKEPPSDQPEISEQEQWRIINETGLLKELPNPLRTKSVGAEEETPFAEEILNAMLLIAPFTFLLVLMDM